MSVILLYKRINNNHNKNPIYKVVGKTLMDDVDYERTNQHRWFLNRWGYVVRYEYFRINGKQKTFNICLHREILNLSRNPGYGSNEQVDHINGNKLDNQRGNLRIVTRSQNSMNQRVQKRKNKLSKYKGVTWHRPTGKWLSQINICGRQKHLGLFVDEINAALVYNENASNHFGEYACLNTI